jgi:hypothetical protein
MAVTTAAPIRPLGMTCRLAPRELMAQASFVLAVVRDHNDPRRGTAE